MSSLNICKIKKNKEKIKFESVLKEKQIQTIIVKKINK